LLADVANSDVLLSEPLYEASFMHVRHAALAAAGVAQDVVRVSRLEADAALLAEAGGGALRGVEVFAWGIV
jgi:hypothetical protein